MTDIQKMAINRISGYRIVAESYIGAIENRVAHGDEAVSAMYAKQAASAGLKALFLSDKFSVPLESVPRLSWEGLR